MAAPARRSTQEPAERIISLLWLLLHSPHGYTRADIRRMVVGYEGLGDAAFEKTFQRDRRALRAVGVPLVRSAQDGLGEEGDDDGRFRVDRGALLMPELDFTVDERRALVRARRLWADSPLRADVVRAVGLLFHPEDAAAEDELAGYHTVMPRSDPRVEALTAAAARQSTVRFTYRDAAGTARGRTVRAWFLTLVRGRWYLTGWDLDRGAERSFRLTRMESDPVTVDRPAPAPARPEGYDAAGLRRRLAGRVDAERVRVWLAPGRGQAVRAAGTRVDPRPADGSPPEAGWELWEAQAGAREDGLAADVAALLGQARFSAAHPELRRRLADDLEAAARVHAGVPDPSWESVRLAPPVRRRARDSSEDLVGRLLDIVGLANRSGGVERSELMARLGVSSRELDRDLETLQYCGMPEREFPGFLFDVEEAGGRVRVHKATELEAPVRLTLPEAHTLVATLQTVADMTVLSDEDRAAARSAQRRIRDGLLAAGEAPAPDAESAEVLDAPADGGGAAVAAHWDVVADPETVRTLLGAIAERRVLRMRYHAVRSDAESERTVEPLAVVQDRAHLYLHAWCRDAGQERVFRVDRVSALAATGETFAPRPRPSSLRPDPAPAGAPGAVEAVLRWEHRLRDASDGWHPTAQGHLPSGDRVTRVLLAGEDVASALVARHGGAVEVLSPAWLRSAVGERAARAVRAVGDAPAG